jgi:uncharacterized SAM-binding protein YcdF (DUF218 family)
MTFQLKFKVILTILLTLILLWIIGFGIFLNYIPKQVYDDQEKTDAIIVLTGGADRLEAGLSLLSQNRAKKLFISGVHRGIDSNDLLRRAGLKPERFSCCLVLGYEADSTFGNAAETAVWMREEKYHSLRLVTGNYHMIRSTAEFKHVMPEIKILTWPVFPAQVNKTKWWLSPRNIQLILSEYIKFLAVECRNFFQFRTLKR